LEKERKHAEYESEAGQDVDGFDCAHIYQQSLRLLAFF